MRNRATLALVLFPLAWAACFLGDDDDGSFCDCPTETASCVEASCEDGECITSPLEGEIDSLQIAGDCKARICDGGDEPSEIADSSDPPDDGNACTLDSCDQSTGVHEPAPAGTPCDAGGFCTAAAECLPCDDDDACTSDECSGGTVVSTPLPEGASCGEESFCDASGVCVSCSDDNPCTADDCSSGAPVHTTLPDGSQCGDAGVCENAICVTWCLPKPDPQTCPDDGAYEATDDTYSGEPQFADDDGAPKPICGVLTPGDVDWVSYYAADRSFENDVNDFLFWSFSQDLRVCSFAKCSSGATQAPCYDGGVPTTGPEGQPGCCWQGVFNTNAYFSMNLECETSDDSGWVRLRIDNPNGISCAPYALRDYGY